MQSGRLSLGDSRRLPNSSKNTVRSSSSLPPSSVESANDSHVHKASAVYHSLDKSLPPNVTSKRRSVRLEETVADVLDGPAVLSVVTPVDVVRLVEVE